tara:strand:+ start:48887 stop:49390 length:504 start_codon:yes stop_codon:yes gene_type:complete
MNKYTVDASIRKSRISHVMYLNDLENIDFVKSISGLVCADLNSGPKVKREDLENVDLLFASDEDYTIEELDNVFDKFIVLHSTYGSVYGIKGNYKEYKLKKSKIAGNINVLGAGDMFASFFMDNILTKNIYNNFENNRPSDLKDIVKNSHLSTSNYLIKLNQRFKLT